MVAAIGNGDTPSDSAYYDVANSTYYFNNYSYNVVVMSGSLTETSNILNGTLNFSGTTTSVSKISYNNVNSTSHTGSYSITFAGTVVYTYDIATGNFTLS